MIKNNVFVILILINLLVLSVAVFVVAGLYHDMAVMQRYNDSLKQSLAEMQTQQEEISKDIRQVKTDSDLVLRIVVSGQYVEE